MQLTPYHAKYLATELTLRHSSNDPAKLTASLQDAQVDLNPHQVEAALFAFNSPLSQGAILADEVGLGKTIEAGIILSQQWAERKRRLLIIAPSNLRKQWSQELADKFFLPSFILESKSFNSEVNKGNFNPFDNQEHIIICSYQFARTKEAYLRRTPWNLVIIDEAHKLRNVYKSSNVIGNSIKSSLASRKKVLLTATPLQNSLIELYGLVSIIDEYAFGDLKSFKSQFLRLQDDQIYERLRERLQPVCKRTLRRQVISFIQFTGRKAMVEEFFPTAEEQALYDGISEYLQRPNLHALPTGQRQLMTLVMRKLLASSSYAIYGTITSLINRLKGKIADQDVENVVAEDYDDFDDLTDEWLETQDENMDAPNAVEFILSQDEKEAIVREIKDLTEWQELAHRIKRNTKADKLLTALEKGFAELQNLGAKQKALVFTESRRTQEFLFNLLSEPGSPYIDHVVLFNGSNTDAKSNAIYKAWIQRHTGTDRISGSPSADRRAAIVEYFKESAKIMIATEAAAEGINLQFCSLVVNYDLPWNPQRIEQRIGRCHRYGQKHDVVVINFLNIANAADQRVYQLLSEKFELFNGVFGASDEVLGAIGSGVDFEKRIARILYECRTDEEIKARFDELDEELREEKKEVMKETRNQLLANVDQEVIQKLKVSYEDTKGYLNQYEQKLWEVTKYFLQDYAAFGQDDYSFTLNTNPFPEENIHPGPYVILRPNEGQRKSDIDLPGNSNIYRSGHPLAGRLLSECNSLEIPPSHLLFDYSGTPHQITSLESYLGMSGWMKVELLTITSFETEDHLVIAMMTDTGDLIEADIARYFFTLSGKVLEAVDPAPEIDSALEDLLQSDQTRVFAESAERDRKYFDHAIDKLELWADDMKVSLERELKDLEDEIKLKKAEARKLTDLTQKVAAQRVIKDLEKERSEKRKKLFLAQDEIDEEKEKLISGIESRLEQKVARKHLFTIRWNMV